jgi:hypothetical protein
VTGPQREPLTPDPASTLVPRPEARFPGAELRGRCCRCNAEVRREQVRVASGTGDLVPLEAFLCDFCQHLHAVAGVRP